MRRFGLFMSVALGLALTLAVLWALRETPGAAAAHNVRASVAPALNRPHDPVVIASSMLPDLVGHSLDEIFVYAYQGAALAQIPSQIDERDANGTYVVVEDSLLDDNDELVFMAADAGGWVDAPWLYAGGIPIQPTYVITLTDPISEALAWAYVFHSPALSRTFTADYVAYEAGTDRVNAPGRYTLGFDAAYGFVDHLVLGSGDADLLDRAKLRIAGTVLAFPFSIDEEDITLNGVHVLDGPVRVTRVSTMTLMALGGSTTDLTTLFAYRSLIVQMAPVFIPGAPAQTSRLRTSVDWNEQALGMVYYDANNPAGVSIDGVPDAVAVSPPSQWVQIAGDTESIVNVGAIPAGLGGAQATYYKDDSAVDTGDTGDQRSYGDAGIQIQDPVPGTYIALGHIYVLTGTTANVGSVFAGYYSHPLGVGVGLASPAWHLYLPVLMDE